MEKGANILPAARSLEIGQACRPETTCNLLELSGGGGGRSTGPLSPLLDAQSQTPDPQANGTAGSLETDVWLGFQLCDMGASDIL